MPSPLCLVLSRPRVVPHRGACLPDASIVAHLDLRLARSKLQTSWCTIAVPFFTGRGIPVKHVPVGVPCARPSLAPSTPSMYGARHFVAPPVIHRPLFLAVRQFAVASWLLLLVCRALVMLSRGHRLLLHASVHGTTPSRPALDWSILCIVAFFVQLPGACNWPRA